MQKQLSQNSVENCHIHAVHGLSLKKNSQNGTDGFKDKFPMMDCM